MNNTFLNTHNYKRNNMKQKMFYGPRKNPNFRRPLKVAFSDSWLGQFTKQKMTVSIQKSQLCCNKRRGPLFPWFCLWLSRDIVSAQMFAARSKQVAFGGTCNLLSIHGFPFVFIFGWTWIFFLLLLDFLGAVVTKRISAAWKRRWTFQYRLSFTVVCRPVHLHTSIQRRKPSTTSNGQRHTRFRCFSPNEWENTMKCPPDCSHHCTIKAHLIIYHVHFIHLKFYYHIDPIHDSIISHVCKSHDLCEKIYLLFGNFVSPRHKLASDLNSFYFLSSLHATWWKCLQCLIKNPINLIRKVNIN